MFFMFAKIFEAACAEVGKAPTAVLKEIGIGKSAMSNWKSGHKPSNRTKKQIADYFGVTVSELMDGKIKKPTGNDELSADEKYLLSGFHQLSPERKALFLAQLKVLQDT